MSAHAASVGRGLRGEAHDDALDPTREERDRRVGLASTRWAIISASPDSDCPQVFSDRLTITAASPERTSRSGSTCSLIISCISYGTPGTA